MLAQLYHRFPCPASARAGRIAAIALSGKALTSSLHIYSPSIVSGHVAAPHRNSRNFANFLSRNSYRARRGGCGMQSLARELHYPSRKLPHAVPNRTQLRGK
jgi:hypothetical protein